MKEKFTVEVNDHIYICDSLIDALDEADNQLYYVPEAEVQIADIRFEDLTLDNNGDSFSPENDVPDCGVDWTSYSCCGYNVFLNYGILCKPLNRRIFTWNGLRYLARFLLLNYQGKHFYSEDFYTVLDEIEKQILDKNLTPENNVYMAYKIRNKEISFEVEPVDDGEKVTGYDVKFID